MKTDRILQSTILLLGAWLLVGLLATRAPAQETEMLTDTRITDAVEDEMLFDQAVSLNNIDVSTGDGIVTLTGKADNALARHRAARLAETIKGVRAVINRIRVQPAEQRSDSAIRDDVRSAMLYDAAVDSYEVDASVSDGVVTLRGTTQSWKEKQLAGRVAMGVRGVVDVQNNIDVDFEGDRPDGEILPEVRKALRFDTLVDHGLIDVTVDDGKVSLSGTIGSAAERRRAEYDAWVTGVRSVDTSALTVRDWAKDPQQRSRRFVPKSSDELSQAIDDALLRDPRVFSFNVNPKVAGSTVTLRGTVDNLKAKEAAGQVARNTVGVTTVTNRIKVRPLGDLSNTEIASNIRDALLRDPYVDRYEITVSVIDGTAYLYGNVDSYFEKGIADDVASRANGVTEVKNRLDVEYGQPLTYEPYLDETYIYGEDWYDYQPAYTFTDDAEIKEEINSELWWSPFVDSDEVTVRVDDGVARLSGTVDSWSEREAARENAYEGGATWVINELDIED